MYSWIQINFDLLYLKLSLHWCVRFAAETVQNRWLYHKTVLWDEQIFCLQPSVGHQGSHQQWQAHSVCHTVHVISTRSQGQDHQSHSAEVHRTQGSIWGYEGQPSYLHVWVLSRKCGDRVFRPSHCQFIRVQQIACLQDH